MSGDLGPVEAALDAELMRLARRAPELAGGTLAAGARALARELDAGNSATSKSMCHRELRETMDRLYELAPPERQEASSVERIRDQLAERRARRAKT